MEILDFPGVFGWLFDYDDNEPKAEDKVSIDFDNEEIDRCVEGLDLDVEVNQYKGSQGVYD